MTLLSPWSQISVLFDGLLYEMGIRPLKPTLERIYRHFRGVAFDALAEAFERIPLVPGTSAVIGRLKKEGFLIALISSGISEPFVQKLARKLDADYAVGPRLEVEEGKLTGRISGEIIGPNGKEAALTRVLKEASVFPSACAVVADDRNNLPMFRLGGLKVGFNPDFALTRHSDQVVRGDLTDVLPILLGTPQPPTLEPIRDLSLIHI